MQNSTRVDMYSWRPGHILRVDIVFSACEKCTSSGISWIYVLTLKERGFLLKSFVIQAPIINNLPEIISSCVSLSL